MKIKRILKRVRKLIHKERHWTTGEFARDMHGYAVTPTSPEAVAFCLLGAIKAVTTDKVERREATRAIWKIVDGDDPPKTAVVEFNDRHDHEEVIGALDDAIKAV